MKVWIRLLGLLLVMTMGLCLFASCKKDPEKPKNNTTNNEDDEKLPYEKDYGIDFGGRTFTICNATNDSAGYGSANLYIEGPSDAGQDTDAVEYRTFQRNAWVEKNLNMVFEYIHVDVGYAEVVNTLTPYLMSESDIDLYINKLYPMVNLSLNGHFANIANRPELQYFENYWYNDYMNEMSLDDGNTAYILAGDYFMDIIQSSWIMLCNTTMLNEVYQDKGGSDAFIQAVFDGNWTYEQLSTLIADAYYDIDGDGTVNDGDRMGLAVDQYWGNLIPMVVSSNLKYIEKDGETWKYALYNDDSLKLFDSLNAIFFNKGTTPMRKSSNPYVYDSMFATESLPYFTNKNALFTTGHFGTMKQIVASETDMEWTVLPFPKLRAEQSYLTPTHDTTEIGAIPRTTSNLSEVLQLLEVLSDQAHLRIMPEYYDKMLKSRYSKNPTVAKMVDLIHDTMGGSFVLGYSNYCGDNFVWKPFYEPLYNGQSFTSNYRSIEGGANGYIETLLTTWKKIRPQ